ncbi:MAG: nuclear transport factor 2 family protein [Solirubrobacteraceae bacterium]
MLVLRDLLGYRAGEVAEMLEISEASVNSLLRRSRAAFESRLPATGRERAPIPNSKLERDIVGRFAETVENGDIDGMVALLTDDAWLTMPPLPHAYHGRNAISAFMRGAEERRGAPMRLVPTRANTPPAFGCYLSMRASRLSPPEASRLKISNSTGVALLFAYTGSPPSTTPDVLGRTDKADRRSAPTERPSYRRPLRGRHLPSVVEQTFGVTQRAIARSTRRLRRPPSTSSPG